MEKMLLTLWFSKAGVLSWVLEEERCIHVKMMAGKMSQALDLMSKGTEWQTACVFRSSLSRVNGNQMVDEIVTQVTARTVDFCWSREGRGAMENQVGLYFS